MTITTKERKTQTEREPNGQNGDGQKPPLILTPPTIFPFSSRLPLVIKSKINSKIEDSGRRLRP
jgi:hypothetical protein